MDKRTLMAFALALALLILWQFLFPPAEQEPLEPVEEGEIAVQKEVPSDEEEVPFEAYALEEEELAREEAGITIEEDREREIVLENSLYIITFRNRGAIAVSWRLKEHLDDSYEPLELISPISKNLNIYPLQLKTGDDELDQKLNMALFETTAKKATLTDISGNTVGGHRVTFKYADGSGLYVEKILEIIDGDYLSNVKFSIQGLEKSLSPSIIWGAGFGQMGAQDSSRFYYSDQAIASISGKIMRIAKKKVENVKTLSGIIKWVGLEDQYFSVIFIPQSNVGSTTVFSSTVINEEGKEEKHLSISVPHLKEGYSLYVGPKDYHILSGIGYDLKYAINFGSITVIAYISKGLFFSLVWLYEHVFPNYGIAIIFVTLLIRIIFFPLTQKSFVSMKKMQTQMKKVQPKISAIKMRYKKKGLDFQSRQKMNQEVMDLYKKEGINPMGGMTGCLPLLLQLPFLWAFYNVLSAAIELRQAPFIFWIQDLSIKDPLYVTPILMGATMFMQQVMTGPIGGDPMQRRMMYMMPIIFTFFFLNFPSGLVLYWLVNNVLGIGQQYLINKQANKLLAETKVKKKSKG